jgi:glycine hydroxymethyltransferase
MLQKKDKDELTFEVKSEISLLRMNLQKIHELVGLENQRQSEFLSLIASENHTSQAIREVLGSRLTDKYAEGYPSKRYYYGCEVVDEIETLAIDSACKLFGCKFANVQPHSGSQANESVFLAFLSPGDKILSLSLEHGGHLTHGYKANLSGKLYQAHHYYTDDLGIIDMDKVRDIAFNVKPKLIIAGASAYARIIDWRAFRGIADEVGAYLLADIAHYSGLVAGNAYPSPVGIADVITSTTHKVLRGPRGGLILWNNPDYTKKINSAVFPGVQGGPMMHSIASKAVCFLEAATDEYQSYAKQVVKNAKVLAEGLKRRGMKIVSDGTDSHLFMVDLRPNTQGAETGAEAADWLYENLIIVNKELMPNDHRKASETSGIRIGVPAVTTRGMKEPEMEILADIIHESLIYKKNNRSRIQELANNFPLP